MELNKLVFRQFGDGRECKWFWMKQKGELENACNTKQNKISGGRLAERRAEAVTGHLKERTALGQG